MATSSGEPETDTPPRVAYTPREVAEQLGIPYRAVIRLINDGELASRRVGAQRFVVPAAAVDEFLTPRSA